jgi:hypothetical protein
MQVFVPILVVLSIIIIFHSIYIHWLHHSRFRPIRTLTSRSADPADRTHASVTFEPADSAFTRIGRFTDTRVADRPSVL